MGGVNTTPVSDKDYKKYLGDTREFTDRGTMRLKPKIQRAAYAEVEESKEYKKIKKQYPYARGEIGNVTTGKSTSTVSMHFTVNEGQNLDKTTSYKKFSREITVSSANMVARMKKDRRRS